MASIKAKTAQEILMNDFQTLVSDTERLLEHTATLAGDQADELREQIHDSLLRARETLKLTEDSLRERGKAAVTATEDYVQANPWQSENQTRPRRAQPLQRGAWVPHSLDFCTVMSSCSASNFRNRRPAPSACCCSPG